MDPATHDTQLELIRARCGVIRARRPTRNTRARRRSGGLECGHLMRWHACGSHS